MRIPSSARLLAAVLALSVGGCSPEAPKLTIAPRKEKPASPPVEQVVTEVPAAPEPARARPPEPVRAKSPEPVREKLGAGQCRTCHRLQYDSWVKSGHARKALDCEGCHGNGSEYAKLEVMKDLARAKSLGLIFQTADFCAKCHPTADASYLPKAHAHPARRK
jgi:hypothetical protein